MRRLTPEEKLLEMERKRQRLMRQTQIVATLAIFFQILSAICWVVAAFKGAS